MIKDPPKTEKSIEKSVLDNNEDIEFIKKFRNGDEQAFNLIVRKYQKKVYWIVRKMVIDHDEADDVTQEIFIKIYSSLKDFRGDSKFFTYLYKITINFSLNRITKNKNISNRTTVINDDTMGIAGDETELQNMDSELKTKILTEAIHQLPAQQRAVFNMRFYDNLSYDEIAEILGKSVGGMKANYFHAVKNIENYLRSFKNSEEIFGTQANSKIKRMP